MLSILPLLTCSTLIGAISAIPAPIPAPLPDPMQLWSDDDLKAGAIVGGGAFLPSVASVQRRSHNNRRRAGDINVDIDVAEGVRVPFEQYKLPAIPKLAKRQGGDAKAGEAGLLNWLNIRYIITSSIASQQLNLIIDSGSTDTFVYTQNPSSFSRIPPDQQPPIFNNLTATNLTVLPNVTYSASYGASEQGSLDTLGSINVAAVGLTGTNLVVPQQPFGGLYSGGGTGASGLLGLGFPIISPILREMRAYIRNTTGRYITQTQARQYYPLVAQLFNQGSIPRQMYAIEAYPNLEANAGSPISFNYTPSAGFLTVGGYPAGTTESSFTWSPVPYVQFASNYVAAGYPNATGFRWTIQLEAIYFNGLKLNNTRQQSSSVQDGGRYLALIDSGNPTQILPSDVMSQITNAYANNRAGRTISCSSPFELVYQFAGVNYTMKKDEMLVPASQAIDTLSLNGVALDASGCQFQAQPSAPLPNSLGALTSVTYQLGDPFYRNVMTVYDYGNIENALLQPPRIGLRPQGATRQPASSG